MHGLLLWLDGKSQHMQFFKSNSIRICVRVLYAAQGAPGERAALEACASACGVPAVTRALGVLQRLSRVCGGEGPAGGVCCATHVCV